MNEFIQAFVVTAAQYGMRKDANRLHGILQNQFHCSITWDNGRYVLRDEYYTFTDAIQNDLIQRAAANLP